MRAAILQMRVVPGDVEHNLGRAEELLSTTSAEVVLLPELFTTGFDYPRLRALALPLEEHAETLRGLAGSRVLAGTVPELRGGRVYNTMLLVDGEGVRGVYRKLHLFGREKEHFAPGEEVSLAHARGVRWGLSICYDLRFPELFRALTFLGAQVVLLSAEFPAERQQHFEVLCRARAIENLCYVLACNCTGRDAMNRYAGGSLAVSPWGEVIARAGEGEEVLEFTLEPQEVERVRESFPALRDAMPERFLSLLGGGREVG